MIRRGLTGCIILTLFLLVPSRAAAQDKLRIVTTLPDLAYLADEIGGDLVETFSIATGYQNPHFVDPKPSYILKLTRADMFITVGLDLELGWVPALLNSARNSRIQPGGEGYVDASTDVPLLEVPTRASREEGDIHIFGNPHYWLDPVRGKLIAQNIYQGLVRVSPENKNYFQKNLENFHQKIDIKMKEWKSKMSKYEGAKIIAYHNQWCYFENQFGLKIVDFLEPKPGIPPSPSQLVKVIDQVIENDIKVIIISPYFTNKSAKVVARETKVEVVVFATSVEANTEVNNYFDIFDYNIEKLIEALEK
ncbi:MAG: metal ABC transporter substrate-binding protein [Bacteroidetes bacterium]|nr:metal ABC transporter substrate-binding protein [Bacteroidota bacterium]